MKKLLLDTHVFLWLRSNPLKLSQTVLQAYEDPNNTVYLSMASVWEMQIKVQLGKLQLTRPLPELLEQQCTTNGLQILPIELRHLFGLGELPLHHKDPFDRLLLVQAQLENAYLVSIDAAFKQYQVNLLW